MQKFSYIIADEVGIHARPAGLIVKEAGKYSSDITVTNQKNGASASAKRLFGIMGLSVKCGDEITVAADGTDETEAISAMEELFRKNL